MKTVQLIYTVIILSALVSCAIISEPDISGETVFLLAPADQTTTHVQGHTLWWQPVSNAQKYHVEMVKPRFSEILQMIVDSNVTDNQYRVILSPGDYQWQVTAYNDNSEAYSTRFNLHITNLDGLSGKELILYNPKNGIILNTAALTFKWSRIVSASDYQLKVKEGDWDIGDQIRFKRFSNSSDTMYIDTLPEGEFSWGVQASNDTNNTQTEWFTETFIIDTTSPGTPNITKPASDYDTLKTDPHRIQWTQASQFTGTNVSEMLYVSTDSLFTSISDSIPVSTTTFSISGWDDGKYWIRIQSVDEAGNRSGYAVRVFYLYKEEVEE